MAVGSTVAASLGAGAATAARKEPPRRHATRIAALRREIRRAPRSRTRARKALVPTAAPIVPPVQRAPDIAQLYAPRHCRPDLAAAGLSVSRGAQMSDGKQFSRIRVFNPSRNLRNNSG